MKTTFVKKKRVGKNIYTFWFKPEKKPHQVAGQFTEIHLKHAHPDKRGIKRFFTLSNSPTEDNLSITTKFSAKSSSFKKTLRQLKPGSELDLASPMGDFVLPKDSKLPLVFVAGGIGVTPFRSILKYLQDTDEKRQITLIYGVKDPKELCFEKLIKRNVSKFVPAYERLSADFILRHANPDKGDIIYLSGPEPMVEVLNNQLIDKKVPKTQLRTDFFPNYPW
jgi:ferredoxin-NADP reductase